MDYIISPITDYDNRPRMCSKNNGIFIWRNYFLNHPDWDDKYVTRIHMGKYHSKYDAYDATKKGYISNLVKIYGIKIDCAPLIYTNGNVKAYAFS